MISLPRIAIVGLGYVGLPPAIGTDPFYPEINLAGRRINDGMGDDIAETIATPVKPGGLVADIKGMWRGLALADALRVWRL